MAVMTASASSSADFDPRRIALRPPRDNRLSDDHSVDLEVLHGRGGEGRRERLAAQIGVRVGGVEVAAAGGDGVQRRTSPPLPPVTWLNLDRSKVRFCAAPELTATMTRRFALASYAAAYPTPVSMMVMPGRCAG